MDKRNFNFLAFGLFLISINNTLAQFKAALVQIDGLTCSMCSLGVQRSMEKIDFVAKVQVDLNENVARVEFKEGQKVNMKAVVKSVEDAGFSVRTLRAKFFLSETIAEMSDPFFVFDNQVYFFLNSGAGVEEGLLDLNFIDGKFSDVKLYRKYRNEIQRIMKNLPDDKEPYSFVTM